MAILFAIVDPKEGKVIENILGLYEDLLTMYEKAKNLTPGDVNNLMVCNVKDDAKTDVLMGMNTFIEILSSHFFKNFSIRSTSHVEMIEYAFVKY